MAHDALQCGFCTPGFIVEAAAFHDRWRATKGTAVPSREEIGAALSGHLCRCGAYDGIFRAVADACTGRFDNDTTAAPPRMEARDKVTGAAKFTVDIRHDGQLEGVILRSQLAHARITSLDLAPAQAIAGVGAVVSLLGDDRVVRFVGAPIAAVAAKDRKTALAAVAAIGIETEELPAAVGLEQARKPDAPVVFEKPDRKKAGNVSEGGGSPAPWKGNIRGPSAAFSKKPKQVQSWVADAHEANNPLLVEGTFRTGTQSHACLEPHAAVARFDGDVLTVHVSTQAVFHLMELIAKRFKLEHDKVRVIADHVGGGFGSKASLGMETIAAIELARAAKAPVRIAYDRHEELSVTGYRPAAEVKIALLPSAQGELKALSLTAYADTGAATNSTIAALARLIYPAEAKALADYDVISNLPPGAAFRGPGGPPMAFALEQAIDEAALRMNADPISLRKRWDPDPQPPASLRLGDEPRSLAQPQAGIGAERPLSPRRRRRHRLLALSVAARLHGRSRGQGWPSRRQHRDAGYRHRHPQRDRQHGGARVRPGAARDRSPDRRFQIAGRTGLGRQPRHRLGGAADAARGRQTQGRDRSQCETQTGPRLECAVARIARGLARSRCYRRTSRGQQADWRPGSSRR